MALMVMSSRLPIGVATIYSFPCVMTKVCQRDRYTNKNCDTPLLQLIAAPLGLQ